MKRVNEMLSSMKSFAKEEYHKSELLTEMLALQQEIVNLTFNGEHASLAGLKIWDVERHLEQLNKEYGHAADEELQKFIPGCKDLCNLIKAEISGKRGENKAYRTLEYLHSQNVILKNIELSDNNLRTELDMWLLLPTELRLLRLRILLRISLLMRMEIITELVNSLNGIVI